MPDETYLKALGAYAHHLNEAITHANAYRSLAFDLKHTAERITAAEYPYSEYHLPPAVQNGTLTETIRKLTELNDAIDHHINEANLHAEEAGKHKLKRKA